MPNILLVEDSATQAMQMKMLLESAKHKVVCVDDGTSALEQLESGFNELVVTDLELPLLNGLDLIKKMQADFPHIPAVLVTARGSERLAAEALRSGAAAYVPKNMLNELLLSTVEDVLGVLRADQSYSRLINYMTENRFIFELPSDPTLIDPTINLAMQMAAGMEILSGTELHRVSLACKHAMLNALYRGNLELSRREFQCKAADEPLPEVVTTRLKQSPYKDRKIYFDARLMRDVFRIEIHDNGPGFNTAILQSLRDPHSLDDDRGRGLVLMHSFMDKVQFNDRGNQVTLIKHCVAR